MRRFYHSLRFKLSLVALALLVIPWAGYRYIQETEILLRHAQEETLLASARSVARLLENRQDLLSKGADTDESLVLEHMIYVHRLPRNIYLDGYADDWLPVRDQARRYGAPSGSDSPAFRLLAGSRDRYIYLLLQIEDDRVVYRSSISPGIGKNDHVLMTLADAEGKTHTYLLDTAAPGWIVAREVFDRHTGGSTREREDRIRGEWQETAYGYNVEVRIPRSFLGDRLSLAVGDLDDKAGEVDSRYVRTSPAETAEELGVLVSPSPVIERLIENLDPDDTRIWVLNGNGQVLARRGQLRSLPSNPDSRDDPESESGSLLAALIGLVLRQPSEAFTDELARAGRIRRPEVLAALAGQAATGRHATPDTEAVILSAAYPITADSAAIGAVLAERTTNTILTVQNTALERLVSVTLIAFVITGLVILGYATLLTGRIRRLRNRIEAAVTSDGRLQGEIPAVHSLDEIGDLGRSFSRVLDRLSEYNRYLENMASRLAHELRTPLTVITTSLENMAQDTDPTSLPRYLTRARQGVERLSEILNRMREATRLEQAMQQAELEQLDLPRFMEQTSDGYRSVYRETTFVYRSDVEQFRVNAAPELLSQALDKLVANAIDFSTPGTPVTLRCFPDTQDQIGIEVINQGPLLPPNLRAELFESMVSVRSAKGDEPHLGLGLYLVRLICEFHGGRVTAENLPDQSGVCFRMVLPGACQ